MRTPSPPTARMPLLSSLGQARRQGPGSGAVARKNAPAIAKKAAAARWKKETNPLFARKDAQSADLPTQSGVRQRHLIRLNFL